MTNSIDMVPAFSAR